ncbi:MULTISPECIES: epoxide hydrolase family protein [unclassified Chelatococcus]|uniref:epoxide hydrolase family protein n=1 Tax=unclassified Chelatococcus TaxID=2638111 RepID=UPI001BCADAA6|nr:MULTISPECIES: epoxide hydrolase family protein [unclassified Chelatococcus]MBS7743498.1 epoxide hydrolase [Chelatococcus sp. HY11]MBX3547019.1 epoxide hydrolase [Chelatococcus sp.]CAH1662400.1 putative epoxide hydrolase [Hyphomicrobiales bacterium]CAH1687594.1 putative epoxide hydrolase [Hyphomicrobiales bacterium]
MTPQPTPFSLTVPDEAIADLRERLTRTRFPDAPAIESWQYGTDPVWMRRLVAYWRDTFDWRAQESRLNALPQYKVAWHGIDLHFLHVPGRGPNPYPLLLSHGWPGSVFEFLELIPRLTDPARYGNDPMDAFTVVVPSLPGYGLSFEPGQKRFGIEAMADCFAGLMSEVLGYERFAAQGGDWGSLITSRLAYAYPERLIGIHLNLMLLRQPDSVSAPSSEERAFLEKLAAWRREESGYLRIQSTRPQTLAFGLTDSPAGLAAWIIEKFRAWSDCGGDLESAFTLDELLANISLYWFTGAIGSSFWPYYTQMHEPWQIPKGEKIGVPTGYSAFPGEPLHPPRRWADHAFSDIRRWSSMSRGGHFAAMEQPDDLAFELREFFRNLRRP